MCRWIAARSARPLSAKARKLTTSCRSATTSKSANIAILCAQVGIAGSAKLGNFVVLAGQVGHRRAFENREQSDRRLQVRRDAQHSRRRTMAGHSRAAGQAGQAHDDRHAAAAGIAAKKSPRGKRNSARTNKFQAVSNLNASAPVANFRPPVSAVHRSRRLARRGQRLAADLRQFSRRGLQHRVA